jgi:triosephosphate isomerase
MRRPLYIANWKMHKTEFEARAYGDEIRSVGSDPPDADIAIAPPFTSLRTVGERLSGSRIHLAAQNLHWESTGAYTGEISGRMLVDLSVRYVLTGHSERRTLFGDTDDRVGRKVLAARQAGLVPVVCVGESQQQREAGSTKTIIEGQLRRALSRLSSPGDGELVVAYEPVWAIGTGLTASPDQADEAHRFLRQILSSIGGTELAEKTRILYGGSVNSSTVASIAAESEVDGCLVGGASLGATSFMELVRTGALAAGARGGA